MILKSQSIAENTGHRNNQRKSSYPTETNNSKT